MDLGYLDLLFDRQFLVTGLTAVAAFATIITVGLPYLQRDTLGIRMKAVSERREELRQRQREAFAKSDRC